MGIGLNTLNPNDTIKDNTKLFGLIGIEAMRNNLFAKVNKIAKENNADVMMIPMNIREDDFYYTITNMKKSKVYGAFIMPEYEVAILDILDKKNEFVEAYGKCDFVLIENEKLSGYVVKTNDIDSNEALAKKVFGYLI